MAVVDFDIKIDINLSKNAICFVSISRAQYELSLMFKPQPVTSLPM